MYQQHGIYKTITSNEGEARIKALMGAEHFASRSALGRRVCGLFDFYDARGKPQLASCVKALRTLDAQGRIALPTPRAGIGGSPPRGLGQAVPAPVDVPSRVDQVKGLSLQLVCDNTARRTWNELMMREHPYGAVRHAGAQIRYLIVSQQGYLGAIGFSAAALAVADRDQWIGWDEHLRARQLHRVVSMSRFLIRPQVECRNLASKVLGLCLRRVGGDFEDRYGYRPYLVETFVDEARHAGTSLSASNWERVGRTAGRGRFAPSGVRVAVKAIWLYALEPDWKRCLGIMDVAPVPIEPLGPGDGLDREQWAHNEFGGAPLGDVRLSRRLVASAAVQADQPMASFVTAAQSDKAMVMGHYRMIDKPAESEITPENILAPHRGRTMQRMQGSDSVLCIQDGTDLNFAEHGGCKGLGLISKTKNSAGTLGLHMHSTLVVNGEGIPLGVPHIQYTDRVAGEGTDRSKVPGKTQLWVRSLRACAQMAQELDGVRPVSVMDREGDAFELFVEQRNLGTVDILVRAGHDRVLDPSLPNLFEMARAAPARKELEIHVARLSARRSTARQKGREMREARIALVELRWMPIVLPPPQSGKFRNEPPIKLNLVHVHEPSAPGGAEPLEWFLLTSMPVTTAAEAQRMLDWYRLRWRIEDWHRVLKSGCKAEYLAHRTGDRIERAVTIKAVIAWRLMAMTLMGRQTPELPADILFSDIEIMALKDFATNRKREEPDHLGAAVLTMAMLGGYLNRENEPPPGHKRIWEGYTRRLAIASMLYEDLIEMGSSSILYQKLRPDKTCEE